MAYNRYQGNSGRYVKVQETLPAEIQHRQLPVPQPRSPLASLLGGKSGLLGGKSGLLGGKSGLLGGLGESLSGITKLFSPGNLETEDFLLLLIVYLLYKESGDTELLIILGALLFL